MKTLKERYPQIQAASVVLQVVYPWQENQWFLPMGPYMNVVKRILRLAEREASWLVGDQQSQYMLLPEDIDPVRLADVPRAMGLRDSGMLVRRFSKKAIMRKYRHWISSGKSSGRKTYIIEVWATLFVPRSGKAKKALLGDRLVGRIRLSSLSETTGDFGIIIDPEVRNLGICKLSLEACVQWALHERMGPRFRAVTLGTYQDNHPMRRAAEQAGFKAYKRLINMPVRRALRPGADEYRFEDGILYFFEKPDPVDDESSA